MSDLTRFSERLFNDDDSNNLPNVSNPNLFYLPSPSSESIENLFPNLDSSEWKFPLFRKDSNSGFSLLMKQHKNEKNQETKKMKSNTFVPANIKNDEEKLDYIRKVAPAYIKALKKYNLDVETYLPIVLAQTALESGWGQSDLAKLYNNLGGEKGTRHERTVTMGSTEYENGVEVPKKGNFLVFDTIDDFVDHHTRRLKTKFLSGKTDEVKNLADYARIIRENGYYTTPLDIYITRMKGTLPRVLRNLNRLNLI